MRLSLFGVALAIALVPSGATAAPQLTKPAAAMTPEHFQSRIAVVDDDLETVAVLSTEPAFKRRRGGIIGSVQEDNFIRAFIDKKTGETKFRIHQWIRYDRGWRNYFQVNYATLAGPQSDKLTVIGRDAGLCPESEVLADCRLEEHFWFPVEETVLRNAARRYQPNSAVGWRFKFKAERGEDWQEIMSAAEIEGLLRAVDAYRISQGL